MRAYLAVKYYEDCRNRDEIEEISRVLYNFGIKTRVLIRDREEWGKVKLEPKELMRMAFVEIDNSDFILIECSEPGIGRSIEAGYAYARRIPIIVIAKKGSEIPVTINGIAKEIITYENMNELSEVIGKLIIAKKI